MRLRLGIAAIGVGLLASCASPPDPAPGRVTLWGTVELVPRKGVFPGEAGSATYGHRSLRDATLVDYSRPGFAVVWVEGEARGERLAPLHIVAARGAARLEPRHAAVTGGARIRVENETSEPRVVSVPSLGVLERIAAGASFEIAITAPGEHAIWLLGSPDAVATVFAAAGPFAVVTARGDWALESLPPGELHVHAWHPRFPGSSRDLVARADEVRRIDFQLGVDAIGGGNGDAGH